MCRKSFSAEMSSPTQSPVLRSIFRSLRIWTLLLYFVSKVFFFFSPLCYPKFSGEFNGGSRDVWGVLFGFLVGKVGDLKLEK